MKISFLLAMMFCFTSNFVFAKKLAVGPAVKLPAAPASPVGKYNQDVNGKCRGLPGHSVCGKYCCINDR